MRLHISTLQCLLCTRSSDRAYPLLLYACSCDHLSICSDVLLRAAGSDGAPGADAGALGAGTGATGPVLEELLVPVLLLAEASSLVCPISTGTVCIADTQ